MAEIVELRVPDLGDFSDVEVIEILVRPGQTVGLEESLVTLETDKATMDIPSAEAGKIISINVAAGDKVSKGVLIATIELAEVEEENFEATQVIDPDTQREIA